MGRLLGQPVYESEPELGNIAPLRVEEGSGGSGMTEEEYDRMIDKELDPVSEPEPDSDNDITLPPRPEEEDFRLYTTDEYTFEEDSSSSSDSTDSSSGDSTDSKTKTGSDSGSSSGESSEDSGDTSSGNGGSVDAEGQTLTALWNEDIKPGLEKVDPKVWYGLGGGLAFVLLLSALTK